MKANICVKFIQKQSDKFKAIVNIVTTLGKFAFLRKATF